MNPYYEQKILSSDPLEVVRLLYQRAISSVADARAHLKHKRIAERSAAIMRAYAAVHQLLAALRPEAAPELCKQLQGLYLYIQQRLLDANMQQADPPLAEALRLLTTLAEAWAGVAEELASKGAHPREAEEGRWSPASEKQMAVSGYGVSA